MSFKGEFKVAGNTYSIIQCSIPIRQKYDPKGKPASGVYSGKIKVILEGTNDGTLGSWMADPTKKQDGKLLFYRVDQDSTFKEVSFEGAYILTLMEHFTSDYTLAESLMLEDDIINTDVGRDDTEEVQANKFDYRRLWACQQRTGMSYCMLVSLTAEKITIDGVEHQN